jgi:hypothetical protein
MVSRPSVSRRSPILLAVLSALLIFIWTSARIHYAFGGNWTAAFCTGTIFHLPPDLDKGTFRFEGAGYDGQFYRLLAHDPFLQRGYAGSIDAPQLRFRRLLIPLSAWLLALGQQSWIDGAYVAIEMVFPGLGVFWCARFMVRRGRSPLWGLLFVVVPASLTSFDRMLVDGPLTAMFAGFLLYCEEERWLKVWVLAMLAALTRDTGLILGAALVTDRLLDRDWRRAAWFAVSGVPAIAWYSYLAATLPRDGPIAILAIPGWGLVRRLLWLRPYPELAIVQALLRVTDVLAVLGLAISIVLAICWLVRRSPGPITLCVGSFTALALVLGAPGHMVEAYGFGRPVSPLLLWIMLEAVSRKKWIALAPPLMVSLSVSAMLGSPLLTVLKRLFEG